MKKYLPGLILCLILASFSFGLSTLIPLGGVTIAILLGIVVKNIKEPSQHFMQGIMFSEKKLLAWAIAFMGVKLDYGQLQNMGFSLIVIIICGIIITISLAIFIGRLIKIDSNLVLLVGVGNAVCGSSAIAAAQSVIKADEEKVGISIAVINFLGTIGIFLLPAIVVLFPFLNEIRGGVLIGNSLQAVGQVSAAGFSIGDNTGQIATLVKMGRILMLLPIVFFLSFIKNGKGNKGGSKGKIPLYIIGFILFSVLGTFKILPAELISVLTYSSKGFMLIAMSAIGMKISISTVLGEGRQALLLGTIVFFCQILFSMGLVVLLL